MISMQILHRCYMDLQTSNILDSLKHPGGALLFGLLEGDATEEQLCVHAAELSQSTVNRKLDELRRLGLIEREPGHKQAKGLRWSLVFPNDTFTLFRASTELTRSLLQDQEEERKRFESGVKRAHASQRLRDVSD